MWMYDGAGKASEVLAEVTAIDPATLGTASDRLMRTTIINILNAAPPNMGVLVTVQSTPEITVITIQHRKFGSYAT